MNKKNEKDYELSGIWKSIKPQEIDQIRLDLFLVEKLTDYSRSRIQQFIREQRVLVDGIPAGKSGQIISSDQNVQVLLPENKEVSLIPEPIPLDIIYEDDRTIIINKPAGMVVHPSIGHETGTLVHAVLAHCDDLKSFGGEIRPGVVHRLDRDTSGIIVMAKDEKAHIYLQKQFKDRQTIKRYLALVDGKPPTPTGRIDAPIGRDPIRRQKMTILPNGKSREAITEYFTKESFLNHTLIEAHPLTGRTHQIRVHAAFIKCPIVGDVLYGYHKSSLEIDRHFLHAYQLTITLPGHQEPQTFEAPLPKDLADLLLTLPKKVL